MLHSHIHVHAHIYIYMLDTYRPNEQQTHAMTKTSSTKYLPLTLFVRVRKWLLRFAHERELETEHKL